jgi:peptide/nickel transport system permease protein
MAAYIFRRVLMTIPVMFGVMLVVFILMRQIPGDPITIFFHSGDIGGGSG